MQFKIRRFVKLVQSCDDGNANEYKTPGKVSPYKSEVISILHILS